jgi:8-oxo-dGTP pyrophosphatase MutT (NUDIX family)
MPNDQSVDIASIKKTLIHKGMVWDLVSDTFEFNGQRLTREYVDHTGAVAVLAFNEKEELLLLRQYRRPVGKYLMELPAGLLDIPGEALIDCAKRELAEEAGLEAANWSELISFHTTPGGNNEAISIFVAKELSVSSLVFEATGEEIDMPKSWVPIKEAVKLVLGGQIMSPSAVVGIMAYQLSKDDALRS